MAAANVVIGSRMLVVAVVTTMCLLLVGAPGVAAGITCGQVAGAIGPCFPYIRNFHSGPLTSNCCAGVRMLKAAARTTADRQAVCVCLQSIGSHIRDLNPIRAAEIPGKCGVKVDFPISFFTDCSEVH